MTDFPTFSGPDFEDESPLEFIEIVWRLYAIRGRVLLCALYQTDDGYQVRVGYRPTDRPIRKRSGATIEMARAHAEELRRECLALKTFLPLE
jgi:hypothetical protein